MLLQIVIAGALNDLVCATGPAMRADVDPSANLAGYHTFGRMHKATMENSRM